MKLARSFVFPLAFLMACADGGGGGDPGTSFGTDGGSGDSGGPDAGTSGGGSDGSGDDSAGTTGAGGTDTGGSGGVVPAAGIVIRDLSVNQGVEIPLAQGGVFVPEADRNAPVIGSRPALVRAFWELDDDWEPREVEARLVLNYSDGTSKTYKDKRTPQGPSNPKAFPGGFYWGIEADDFQGDAKMHVEVLEVDGIDRGDAAGSRLPESGEQPLLGVTRRMLLDVVVVPTCGRPALAEWEQEIFTAYLYNTFPINEIQITFHDPVSGGCDEVEAAYTTMPDLRYAESAPPWRYYGGLVLGGCGGIAQYGGGPWAYEKDAPRVFGLCDWRGTFPTVDLFAHELGHVHGRDHTFEDWDYPHEDCGGRPGPGFGLMPADMPSNTWGDASVPMQQLIPPSYSGCSAASWNDFMSYAYPYWVSDYTYRGAAEVIWVTSQWADDAGGADVGPGVTLRGAMGSDGEMHWGATRGVSEYQLTASAPTKARFFDGDQLVAEHAVGVAWTHADPRPGAGTSPKPIQVFSIQVPEGLIGDHFELELDGQTRSFSTDRWR